MTADSPADASSAPPAPGRSPSVRPASGGYAYGHDAPEQEQGVDRATYPFHGVHQAGITTPVQDRLHFAAFDVTTESRAALVGLLRAWTEAAREMTAGTPLGGSSPDLLRRPARTTPARPSGSTPPG